MDSVLQDSLTPLPDVDPGRRPQDDVLWFALKVFLFLAVFEIVVGTPVTNLILLATAFYFSAGLAYVGGLLLAHHESARPPDERYPYGYGNRAAVFQLVSLCMLGVGALYLLVLMLETPAAASSGLGLGGVLVAAAALVVVFSTYCRLKRGLSGTDSLETASLRLVFQGAILVSAVALAAIGYGHFFRGGRTVLWAAALIVLTTLCLFVRGFYETFRVVTDRTALMPGFADALQLAQRAAREADILGVHTRTVGKLTHMEVRVSFPGHATIRQANAIENDVETVLRRRTRRVGQVVFHWE